MLANLLLAVRNTLHPAAPRAAPPVPVAAVDLGRYLGRWYEVARIPNPEQDGGTRRLVDVTATYARRPDGSVSVDNRGRDAGAGMRPRGIRGRARAVDASGAKLRVTFFGLFSGPYWVLGLDPDYRWAVVGAPSRRRLWLLARTPTLPADDYRACLAIAAAQGYDPARLRPTPQTQARG